MRDEGQDDPLPTTQLTVKDVAKDGTPTSHQITVKDEGQQITVKDDGQDGQSSTTQLKVTARQHRSKSRHSLRSHRSKS